MTEKKEKPYTLKTARTEIKRLEQMLQKKKESAAKLKIDIKAINKQLKELRAIHENLEHEYLQNQITAAWFKEKKLSGEQITKLLELGKQLGDKIDNLSVGAITEAVSLVCDEQQPENATDETGDKKC